MSENGQTTGLAAVLAAVRDFFVPILNRIQQFAKFINYPVQMEIISAPTIQEAASELQEVIDYMGNQIYIPKNSYFTELPNATPCVVSLMINNEHIATYIICKTTTNNITKYSCLYNIEGYTIGLMVKRSDEINWNATLNDLA